MHILAEGKDHPNSNIGFRSADVSAPLVTPVVPFLVHGASFIPSTFSLFHVKYFFLLSAFNSKDWQGICK